MQQLSITDDIKEALRRNRESADRERQRIISTTPEFKQLEAENKKLKGQIINLEKDRNGYKRDSEKYLKVLKDKKICPDCGTVDDTCDCPFG